MKIRKPAMLAATAALAVLPALSTVVPAQAAAAPARAAVAAPPTQAELIALILGAFPANIQADVAKIMAGDYMGGIPILISDLRALTPAQRQEIVAKLKAILGKLPAPQQKVLRKQLKGGLTNREALQVLLAAR